ncbi:MAG: hypothetical protein NVS3B26_07690 [Mycobacteriales bacterium]
MTVLTQAEPSSHRNELGELYTSYKQLVLALAAGLIFEDNLGGVTAHAVLLRDRCTSAVAAACPDPAVSRATEAVAVAVSELMETLDLVRDPHGEADAGLERVRQRHRSLRRQVWGVLPFEYPSCASEHSHGGQHKHQHVDKRQGSSDT